MMNPGLRDRRITLLKRVTTRSSTGAQTTTYVPTRKLWAYVHERRARERTQSGIAEAVGWELRASVLYSPDITADDRIEYKGVVYEIQGFAEIGRRESLELALGRVL